MILLNLNDFYKIINQEGYVSAFGVVVIVSLGKLFSMSMGCLNNIISNSKYYSYVFWFSVSSALLAVVLNYYFINSYGILGAAMATLIVIVFINLCKKTKCFVLRLNLPFFFLNRFLTDSIYSRSSSNPR